MSTIYVVIKVASEITGEWTAATTERAFHTREMAQAYLANLPIVWEETLNGTPCYCERAVHETNLESLTN